MSRKSRQRMMLGRVNAKDGEVRHGAALKVPAEEKFGPLTTKKRARMLEYLALASGEDREGVREYLRQDGGEKASALLAELENRWEHPSDPPTG
jgi:hypothetical protein